MKILITNHHLRNKAGSEIFTFDLAVELKRRGHTIFVFSFDLGNIAKKIQEKGIPITNDLLNFEKEKFDIIHAQHNTTAIIARSVFPNTPMVFMSHGILPELEQPPSIEVSISKYVAISEEVKDHLIGNYSISENKIEIVRNFIDLDKFRAKKSVQKKPKKLLVLSNHYTDEVKNIIELACKELNIKADHIGLPENPVENVEDYINNSDIVVTLGRGVLESIACERNVIVYDMHGGDGFIGENNFFEIRKNNFSGRRFKKEYSVEDFKKEILKYDPKLGEKLRKIAEKENSRNVIVDKIIKLYDKTVNSGEKFISHFKKGQLYNEINFLEKFFVENEKRNHKINNLNQAIRQKDQELNNLNRSIQRKEQQINNLNQTIQQKDREVKQRNRKIANLKQTIQQKDRDIQQKDREANNLNQAVQRKDQEIEFMESSKFWKARARYLKIKNKVNRLFAKNELITVIIPIYDRVGELKQSIESILNQTYQNFELILVTDGSPRKTIKVVESYRKNPRVRIFHYYDNSGNAVRGRNKGIKEAKSKFIAFQDSDDIAERDRLEKSMEYIKKYNADVVYGGWKAVLDGTRNDTGLKNGQEVISPDCDLEMLKETCVPCQSTVMVKKSALLDVGGLKPKMKYREDHELWLRLAYLDYKFKAIPEILTNLRLHKGNNELNFRDSDDKWHDLMMGEYKSKSKLV